MTGIVSDVNHTNIEALIAGADLVMDGADNFETRFLLNDACVKHGIPWVYGACISSYGLSMVIVPGKTPCLRCVIESAPPPGMSPTCDTAGVLGPVVGIIASFQCAEALKLLTGNGGRAQPRPDERGRVGEPVPAAEGGRAA